MAARTTQKQGDALIAEIERYLTVVDTFRTAGCEPRWRFEYPRACPTTANCDDWPKAAG